MTNLSNDIITVVRDPMNTLGKRFVLNSDGSIDNPPGVEVSKGEAVMRHVPDSATFAKLLAEVSNDPHAALINASFKDIDVGEPFLIYSEALIRKEFNLLDADRDITKGIHEGTHRGKPIKVAGRLKENVLPSSWQFIDRDIDQFTPQNFVNLDRACYLFEVDKLLPGFSKADKVFSGSTSARVINNGEPISKGNGHIWFRLENPSDVERMRVALIVQAAKLGMTWAKPKFSRKTGEICSYSLATILDTSVFTPGRLVFVGRPEVSKGLLVADRSVEVIPGEQRAVDSSLLVLPEAAAIREITKAAGVELSVSASKSGGLVTTAFDLSMDLELDTKDHGVITVAEALEKLESLKLPKIKCQTPFRESKSMAAFLAIGPAGFPFVHDVGTSTNHRLSGIEICKLEFAEPCEVQQDSQEGLLAKLSRLLVNYGADDALEFMPHVVDQWLPCDEVTMLAGHGGGGKSYVALSLAIHVALGLPVGGLATKQTNVLFFSGEDGAEVLKMRLTKLCRELKIERSRLLGKLHLLDVSDIDPVLHRETKVDNKVVTQTGLLKVLADLVESLKVGFVIIDNASDTYDDDEIRRARVRAFVRSLRSKLARPGRAVLLLVHVNKASAANGKSAGAEDYSGSTAWHNSVRSRLSLTPNSLDSFTIEHPKANNAAKAEPVCFKWRNGVPIIASAEEIKAQADTLKIEVLTVISDLNRRKDLVPVAISGNRTSYHVLSAAPGYPASLHKATSATGASKRLNTLCEELLQEGLIRKVEHKTTQRKTIICYEITEEGHQLLFDEMDFLK